MSQIKSEPYVGPWASLTPKTDKKYHENSSHFPFEPIAPVVFRTICQRDLEAALQTHDMRPKGFYVLKNTILF